MQARMALFLEEKHSLALMDHCRETAEGQIVPQCHSCSILTLPLSPVHSLQTRLNILCNPQASQRGPVLALLKREGIRIITVTRKCKTQTRNKESPIGKTPETLMEVLRGLSFGDNRIDSHVIIYVHESLRLNLRRQTAFWVSRCKDAKQEGIE